MIRFHQLALRSLGWIGMALLAGIVPACSRPMDSPPPGRPIHDLAAEAPFGESLIEFDELHFGTPEARSLLGSGWSYDEISKIDGETSVWGLGEESTFEVPLVEPRELELSLDGRAFVPPGAPQLSQTVTVTVGSREVGRLTLGTERSVQTVTVPADALAVGHNTVRLRYAFHHAPASFGINGDQRPLAVAWYRVGLRAAETAATASAVDGEPRPLRSIRAEGDRLFVPSGTLLKSYARLPEGAELRIDDWQLRGDARARASLSVRFDRHGETRKLVEWNQDQDHAALRFPLSTRDSGCSFAEITVKVAPGTDGSGLVLTSPTIFAPSQSSPAECSPTATDPTDPADSAEARVPSAARPPNILLYLVDTLRADRLGTYGRERVVSPRLDSWAESATVFENAVAQSSWTKSSVASILTGLWPPAHGALRRSHVLVDEMHTLPELLSAHGYRTAAFVTNPNVTDTFGFDQGFDTFEYLGEKIRAEVVNARAEPWLRDRVDDPRPFFLWLHTLDPHAPYEPLATERERFAPDAAPDTVANSMATLNDLQAGRRTLTEKLHRDLLDLYDAEIAANDTAFGVLIDRLDEFGLARNTLVLFVSDHGEEFNEHSNWQHGRALHVESLHVPLIVRWPGQEVGQKLPVPVEHLDLLPTILGAAGLPVPDAFAGRDLRPLSISERANDVVARKPIVSYLELDGPARISVRYLGWKSIHQIEDGLLVRPRLFDLQEDPEERTNLAEARPVVLGALAQIARRRLAGDPAQADRESIELDDELTEQLRALGYLQ